jgi:hypothetical protein
MVAQQTLLSLQPTWLNLNMNPSTGRGGTSYGDSGGPHFLGGMQSNLIVADGHRRLHAPTRSRSPFEPSTR